jgi:hypothetical protein
VSVPRRTVYLVSGSSGADTIPFLSDAGSFFPSSLKSLEYQPS